jgi:hypothetical protein
VNGYTTLIDYRGTYGGGTSREEVIRALKEALALVENTPRDAELACAGLRVEVVRPGTVVEGDRRSRRRP